jgi:hypothetical protein
MGTNSSPLLQLATVVIKKNRYGGCQPKYGMDRTKLWP